MTWATFSGGQTPGVPRPHSLPFPRARRSNRSRERRRASTHPQAKNGRSDPIRGPAGGQRTRARSSDDADMAGRSLPLVWPVAFVVVVSAGACVCRSGLIPPSRRPAPTHTHVCSSGGGARLRSVQPAVAFLVRPRAAHGRVVRSGRAGGHVPTFCPCVRACVYQCLCVRRHFFF
jgi:hypothetical protein